MAIVGKTENGNYPFDVYIFGKGVKTGGELPIKENAKSVLDIANNVISTVEKGINVATKTGESAFDLVGFIKENWKLLSIGGVALLVLIKD